MADRTHNTRRRKIKQKEMLDEDSDFDISKRTRSMSDSASLEDFELSKRRGRPPKKSNLKKSQNQANKLLTKSKSAKKEEATEDEEYAELVRKNIEKRNAMFASLFQDLNVQETKNIKKPKKRVQQQDPDNDETENEAPKKRVKYSRKATKKSPDMSPETPEEVIAKYNTRSRNKAVPRRNMKEWDSEDSFSEILASRSASEDSLLPENDISRRIWASQRTAGPVTRKQLTMATKLETTEKDNKSGENPESTETSQQAAQEEGNEQQNTHAETLQTMSGCQSFTSSNISATDDETNSKDETYEPSLSGHEEVDEDSNLGDEPNGDQANLPKVISENEQVSCAQQANESPPENKNEEVGKDIEKPDDESDEGNIIALEEKKSDEQNLVDMSEKTEKGETQRCSISDSSNTDGILNIHGEKKSSNVSRTDL